MMALKRLLEPSEGSSLMMAVVACGADYYSAWERFSLPNWQRFAQRHGYGIAVLTDSRLESRDHVAWNKFLLPRIVREECGHGGSVLVLDADQVFSPIAPPLTGTADAFGLVAVDSWDSSTVLTKKLMSFLRKHFIDSNYPLDSALVMSKSDYERGEILGLDGHLPISSGFVLVPPALADDFAAIASRVDDPLAGWDGGGGDQTIATLELQQRRHYFLDRRWQAIWPDIMAQHYASLYMDAPVSHSAAQAALASALFGCWCIHFATSWPEKQYWEVDWLNYWDEKIGPELGRGLGEYLEATVLPKSYGRIYPPDTKLVLSPDPEVQ